MRSPDAEVPYGTFAGDARTNSAKKSSSHLDLLTDDHTRRGMSARNAHDAALRSWRS